MRHFLIPVLLLSLVAGCSSIPIGPHHIDVQQGNALDQENVARLKPGLNRSQVRFLLGTPLVVDPFRTDRWDYVYVFYKAGRLAEQKRITLFFDGDTLARIEGDLPPPAPAAVPAAPVAPSQSKADTSTVQPASPAVVTTAPLAPEARPASEPLAPAPIAANPQPVPATPAAASPASTPAAAVTAPVAAAPAPAAAARTMEPATSSAPTPALSSSVVPPLPSPKNAPAYVDPRPTAELSLQPETDVMQIKPDVVPSFPDPHAAAAASDAPILEAVQEWANAWGQRNEATYLAAYDESFVPQGGNRAEWAKRRHLQFTRPHAIDLRIESPTVQRAADGSVSVTFNQFYRSDTYRDAVVKQLRMIERDGHWLITDEKVLSVLRGARS